ncbi:MAG: hypothetical protein ACT4OP_02560 [Actinomycetota bacterium]
MVRQPRVIGDTRAWRLLIQAGVLGLATVGLFLAARGGSLPPLPEEEPPVSETVHGINGGQTHQARMNRLIAECMAQRGFEWVPPDGMVGHIPAYNLSPADFTRLYGYGVATAVTEELFDPVEPPQPTFDQLTPAEQQAYDWALYGHPKNQEEVRDTSGRLLAIIQPDSCIVQADEKLLGPQRERVFMLEQTEGIAAEVARLAEQDPRLLDVQKVWQGCMSDAGYQFSTRNEIVEALHAEVNGLGLESGLFSSRIDPTLAEALAELQERELAIASADRTCDLRTGLAVMEWKVRRAYEIDLGAEESR